MGSARLMTDFTFHGIVRYGYGFYNPNHAAALICVFFPFLWIAWLRWKNDKMRIVVAVFTVIFLIALGFTYSRTGIIVLTFEAIIFCVLMKVRNPKLIFTGVSIGFLIFLCCGVLTRFTLDDAFLNRLKIWRFGCSLFASNPWYGVGLGHSGSMISLFLLPENITCRTLVNSHLTLLAEFGIFAGVLWLFFIFYALLCGRDKTAAWTAFAGLCISACSASIFDWDILFDFQRFGSLSTVNFVLSWFLFFVFVGLGIFLLWRAVQWRYVLFSLVAVLVSCGGLILLFQGDAPTCAGEEIIVKQGKSMPLVLYDDDWTLETVLPFLSDGYYLTTKSSEMRATPPDVSASEVYLFGKCVEFASFFPRERLILISPPEIASIPENTERILLREYQVCPDISIPVEFY